MFEPMQIITFQQKEGTLCSPEAPQYAGTQGDNGKTRVDFVLPADAQNDAWLYRVEMVTGGGALVTGELLTPENGIVSQVLTHPFTEAGGRCTLRLIVTEVDENGDETGEYCALVARVYFTNSPADTLPAVKHGISEMLLGVAADAELTAQLADEAARLDATIRLSADRAEAALQLASDAANNAATAQTATLLAQNKAEQAAKEAAASAAQALPPLYATYEVTPFSEIVEAYKSGRVVYCVYYAYIGTLSILLDQYYATFDLVDASGCLLTLRVTNGNVWSKTSAMLATTASMPAFTTESLVAGLTATLSAEALYMATGTSMALLTTDWSATDVVGFQCLRSLADDGSIVSVIQYQQGDSTTQFRTITGNITVRNDSSDVLVLNALKKEA